MSELNTIRNQMFGAAIGAAGLMATMMVSTTASALERFNISNDSFCVAAETGSDCDGFEQWKTYQSQYDANALLRIEGWAFTEPGATNNKFGEANLIDYGGGTGIRNGDYNSVSGCGADEDCYEGGSPEHAIDNNDRDEFVLVEFETDDWAMTHVGTGWAAEDNGSTVDIQVWYWDGAASGPGVADGTGGLDTNGGGRDLSGGDLTGWALLGDYTFDEYNPGTVSVQSSTVPTATSKYWLVSPKVCNVSNSCGDHNDHFKLNLIKGLEVADAGGNGPSVPEPATALLLLAALPFARKRLGILKG